jgi:CRISPR-associated protein Cas2
MTVLVLSAVPPGLRGTLTRWLMEVQPGVFVGKLSRRIQERIWRDVRLQVGDGQAVLIFPARSEQGFSIWSVGRDRWKPVDLDGLTLMLRPVAAPHPELSALSGRTATEHGGGHGP